MLFVSIRQDVEMLVDHFVELCQSTHLLLSIAKTKEMVVNFRGSRTKKKTFLLLEILQESAEQTIFLEKALKCVARCCKSTLIGKSDCAGEFSGVV